MLLPAPNGSFAPPEVTFPPFHSGQQVQALTGVYGASGAELVRRSPNARTYALAQRLERHAATPYAFVHAVMRYLGHGYSYNENPPPSRYPLETFLFDDKIGYCQQFAGAMAMLLRMGGVPARVAVGFTTGTRHGSTYVVTDVDAHAWVEAWFPQYGWVKFDPTPAAAPARGGHLSLLPALKGSAGSARPVAPVRKPEPLQANTPVNGARHAGGSPTWLLVVAVAIGLALLVALLRTTARFRDPSPDELLTELERALARSGRPAGDGVTLAALERRYRGSPEAVAYIRAIRLMRFSEGAGSPTKAQRRALRAQLCAGLGLSGKLRALWALPPRWTPVWVRLRGAYTHSDG